MNNDVFTAQEGNLVSCNVAAKYFGVNPDTLSQLIKKGILPADKRPYSGRNGFIYGLKIGDVRRVLEQRAKNKINGEELPLFCNEGKEEGPVKEVAREEGPVKEVARELGVSDTYLRLAIKSGKLQARKEYYGRVFVYIVSKSAAKEYIKNNWIGGPSNHCPKVLTEAPAPVETPAPTEDIFLRQLFAEYEFVEFGYSLGCATLGRMSEKLGDLQKSIKNYASFLGFSGEYICNKIYEINEKNNNKTIERNLKNVTFGFDEFGCEHFILSAKGE